MCVDDRSDCRDKETITKFIATLKYGPEEFDFAEGTISFLGVDIQRLSSNSGFTMSQPFLIERILDAANTDVHITRGRHTPAVDSLTDGTTDEFIIGTTDETTAASAHSSATRARVPLQQREHRSFCSNATTAPSAATRAQRHLQR